MKVKTLFASLLVVLVSLPANAGSKPLYVWKDGNPSEPALGKIWALSGINSENVKVVVSQHESVGFRCQSLSCPIPTGYSKIKYTFNCPKRTYIFDTNGIDYRTPQELSNLPNQANFSTWEVFAVACPMWKSQIQNLRREGSMYSNGYMKVP